jgi:hypothetical protein
MDDFYLINNAKDNIIKRLEETIKLPRVTKLVIVDKTGRVYTAKNSVVELSYQDKEKTLKIFVTQRIETSNKNEEQK